MLDTYEVEESPRRLDSELSNIKNKNCNVFKEKIIEDFLNEYGLTKESFIKLTTADSYISTAIKNLAFTDEILSSKELKKTRVNAALRFANEYPLMKSRSRSKTPVTGIAHNKSEYEEFKECSFKKLVELSYNIKKKLDTHINNVIDEVKSKEKAHRKSIAELEKINKSLINTINQEKNRHDLEEQGKRYLISIKDDKIKELTETIDQQNLLIDSYNVTDKDKDIIYSYSKIFETIHTVHNSLMKKNEKI